MGCFRHDKLTYKTRGITSLLCLILLSGCLAETTRQSTRSRTSSGIANTPASVAESYGRILTDNPIALTNNYNLDASVNLNSLLKTDQFYISNRETLEANCEGYNLDGNIYLCYQVQKDKNSLPLPAKQKRWAFDANSEEFLQVNTFAHMGIIIKRYLNVLKTMFTTTAQPSLSPALNYQTALPQKLYQNYAHWYGNVAMVGHANCGEPDNAYFETAAMTMCLGEIVEYPAVKMGHDPSVIYHEMGHGFSTMFMNMRNIGAASPVVERTTIGYSFYDEAGSINEGVSDWFSHMMNARTRFGEWGLGRFLGASRPVVESDGLHVASIKGNSDARLIYPDLINYDPNESVLPYEDVHNAGMNISHFLVAFQKELMSFCGMSHSTAGDTILHLLIEAYAELGDLTSTGSDHSYSYNFTRPYVNHSKDPDSKLIRASEEWHKKVNPVNYRNFYQKFAKYAYLYLSKGGRLGCNGVNYPKDNLEALLDKYGVLLFDNYNEDGSDFGSGAGFGTSTAINSANRVNSVLINKSLLKLDERPDKSKAFIFDGRSSMLQIMQGFQSVGLITQLSSKIPAEFPYNNGNGQISPGEVFAIFLNLYNDSNSHMGGVQVLANDWDHIKLDTSTGVRKPCNTFEDAWPIETEGAADVSDETLTVSAGDCKYITRTNGNPLITTGSSPYFPPNEGSNEVLHPVCFVQINDSGATRWASQKELLERLGMSSSDCLGGADSQHDCFIRAIRGADSAWFSRIAPKKNWGETIYDDKNEPAYNTQNLLYFEASPDIPPGTTFDCRFRARFSNCKDCFIDSNMSNGEDYRDYEYSGGKPFKILHYQFTVTD